MILKGIKKFLSKIFHINFFSELREVFDQSCDFKNMNRTQTLIELMRGYVDKTIPEIQNWNTLYQMTGRTPLNRV